jgi:hypothetical protein
MGVKAQVQTRAPTLDGLTQCWAVLTRSISLEPRRYGSPDKAEQSLADEPINEIKVLNLKACFGGPILEVL